MSYLDRLQGDPGFDDTVNTLLRGRDPVLHVVAPGDTVAHSITLLCEHDIGAVPVIEAGELVGILSERDCVRRVVAKRLDPDSVTVGEVMTREVMVSWPLQQIEACLEMMNDHNIRHMPVVEKGVVLGMISLRDLAAAELDRRQALLDKLDEFVLG